MTLGIIIIIDTRWDKVISNILDYLTKKENDDDDEVRTLYLLYETRELLKKEKRHDVKDVQDKEIESISDEHLSKNTLSERVIRYSDEVKHNR